MRRTVAAAGGVLLCLAVLLTSCAPALSSPATIEYDNAQYGFRFTLSASWKGYSVVVSNWTGDAADPNTGEVPVLNGPMLLIRHPLWTQQNPRQDIPIMIFTHPQWDALQRGEFLVSAAGVGPTELGENAQYVFALPPRYNYALLEGWQEVDRILQGHPLHTP